MPNPDVSTPSTEPAKSESFWRYRAFISYSHKDESWAKWLQKAIETYRVPGSIIGQPSAHGPVPKRLGAVFRDRDELASSGNLSAKLQEALQESLYLIVICSRSVVTSKWVNAEIQDFRRTGLEGRILCLLVEGEPNESTPPALREFEPILADARSQGDGKEMAKLKILAPLVGVRFDDLRQRERRRQIARRRLWTAGSALLAVSLFCLYVGLADAGAPLPGSHGVQTFLDRYNASVFRRVPSDPVIFAGASATRRQLLDRLLRELQEGDWVYDSPTHPSEHRREMDFWTAGQALYAMLTCPEATPDELRLTAKTLESAFDPKACFEVGGVKYGWLSARHSYPIALTSLWVATAAAKALARPELSSPELKEQFKAHLRWAQEAATHYHPVDDGGWNTFPNQSNPREHETYVTVLALLTLLEAHEAKAGWDGNGDLCNHLIESTRNYLCRGFDTSGRVAGWDSEDSVRGFPLDGMTLQAFAVLMRAETDGCGAVPAKIRNAIRDQLVDLATREFDYPMSSSRSYRAFTDQNGTPQDEYLGIGVLWYPWAVDACQRWLSLASSWKAAPEDITRVRRSLAHLVVRLNQPMFNEYLGSPPGFSSTYRISETLMTYSDVSGRNDAALGR